ncbi:MAG: 3-hydroxyacyl-CoA dehydrogenase NAD-binding domain-containing protein [Thermodesulfobacteriota bacterium]
MSSVSYTIDDAGIAVLTINTPGSTVNRLGHESFLSLEEFLNKVERELDMLESSDEIRAVVITSAKDGSFISGADPGEFLGFTLADEGRSYSLKAQELAEKIENSRAPFVAAINGECLGLGLELAIACKYRVGADNRKTALGLDQIDFGLIPCAGGILRLAKLIGTKETLDMILSGEAHDSHHSRQIGILDEVVPEEYLMSIARKRALDLSGKEFKPRRLRFGGVANALIKENPVSRKMYFDKAKKEIKESRELYLTASRMAIEALEIGVASFNRGLHVESVYFGELAVTGYSRQLIRSGIAIDEVRNDAGFSKAGHKTARKKTEKIALVGEETHGAGIACLAAEKGVRVRIKSRDAGGAAKNLKACFDFFMEKLANHETDELGAEKSLDLISAAPDYTGFKRADIVIESAGEDPDVKRGILKDVEPLMSGECIYVSNSFALPVALISGASKRPERVVGMRIPGPVQETELMEVAVTEDTSQETVAELIEFGKSLGKIPLVVKNKAGFYTTRIQLAYFNEALHLLGEGIGAQDIEDAMIQFGFPEGPLSAMDEIGLDLVQTGSRIAFKQSAERMKPLSMLDRMIEDGRTGVRGGRGFYRYGRDEKRLDRSLNKLLALEEEDSDGISQEYIQDRLVLAMVNEAMLCLQDEVIGSARDGDVGALLGLGFPTYRGGPFRYVDSAGAGEILKKLHNLSVRYGTRYTPPVILKNTAVGGNKFYEN